MADLMAERRQRLHDERDVPEGYELIAVPAGDWRLENGKHCRRTVGHPPLACGKPSVAAINRGRYTGGECRDSWWAYCADHLYGQWIEGDQVMRWILRKMEVSDD